jgi:hypothetical protein
MNFRKALDWRKALIYTHRWLGIALTAVFVILGGIIALRLERASRWNRWLYHGFHSLDFPFLYYKRRCGTSW